VVFPCCFVVSGGNDFVIFHDDCANHWVWVSVSPCLFGLFKGEGHRAIQIVFHLQVFLKGIKL
jgi:hypothetical protein